MNLDMINPYIMKIVITARKEDSISAIAQRIGLSYGWTHTWVKALVKEGVFKEKWRGIILQEKNKSYISILKFIKNSIPQVSFYYTALQLSGVRYCFTKTDAVYVWTDGRYNLARYKHFYPIFIKIQKEDSLIFKEYCKKLGLKIKASKSVFYMPQPVEHIESVKKKGYSVESLDKSIEFMKENIYNFEPALEMVDEMYDKKLNIKYKEVNFL